MSILAILSYRRLGGAFSIAKVVLILLNTHFCICTEARSSGFLPLPPSPPFCLGLSTSTRTIRWIIEFFSSAKSQIGRVCNNMISEASASTPCLAQPIFFRVFFSPRGVATITCKCDAYSTLPRAQERASEQTSEQTSERCEQTSKQKCE